MYVGVCGVVVWWLVCFVRIVDVDVDVMCGGVWWYVVVGVFCVVYFVLACLLGIGRMSCGRRLLSYE